jgi:hypothetical protein
LRALTEDDHELAGRMLAGREIDWHDSTADPPWLRLGMREILPSSEESQVRELLAASLPAGITSPSLRRDVEQALIEAVARKQRPGVSPRVVVAPLAGPATVDADCNCWSFFVLERPGGPGESVEVIELCLYRE